MLTSPGRIVLDIGNTLIKIGVYRGSEQKALKITDHLTIEILEDLRQIHNCNVIIIAAVAEIPDKIHHYIRQNYHVLILDHTTPVPIQNLYKTPETLGKDRLAVAVAAADLFPGKNCLIIDAGTCITYDFIDRIAQYHGGAISPGIPLRFKALHTFTQKLPLVNHKNFEGLAGSTTEESILSGVLNGAVAEMEGTIRRYDSSFPGLQVILTGGDMNFFDRKLKSHIFAIPNLVLKGLNVILDFNVKKQ